MARDGIGRGGGEMRLIDADALMEEVNIEIKEYMLTEKVCVP